MKRAKQRKRVFKDLSAWNILTGEAEKGSIQEDWDAWANAFQAGLVSKKFIIEDYLTVIRGTDENYETKKVTAVLPLESSESVSLADIESGTNIEDSL